GCEARHPHLPGTGEVRQRGPPASLTGPGRWSSPLYGDHGGLLDASGITTLPGQRMGASGSVVLRCPATGWRSPQAAHGLPDLVVELAVLEVDVPHGHVDPGVTGEAAH